MNLMEHYYIIIFQVSDFGSEQNKRKGYFYLQPQRASRMSLWPSSSSMDDHGFSLTLKVGNSFKWFTLKFDMFASLNFRYCWTMKWIGRENVCENQNRVQHIQLLISINSSRPFTWYIWNTLGANDLIWCFQIDIIW